MKKHAIISSIAAAIAIFITPRIAFAQWPPYYYPTPTPYQNWWPVVAAPVANHLNGAIPVTPQQAIQACRECLSGMDGAVYMRGNERIMAVSVQNGIVRVGFITRRGIETFFAPAEGEQIRGNTQAAWRYIQNVISTGYRQISTSQLPAWAYSAWQNIVTTPAYIPAYLVEQTFYPPNYGAVRN